MDRRKEIHPKLFELIEDACVQGTWGCLNQEERDSLIEQAGLVEKKIAATALDDAATALEGEADELDGKAANVSYPRRRELYIEAGAMRMDAMRLRVRATDLLGLPRHTPIDHDEWEDGSGG